MYLRHKLLKAEHMEKHRNIPMKIDCFHILDGITRTLYLFRCCEVGAHSFKPFSFDYFLGVFNVPKFLNVRIRLDQMAIIFQVPNEYLSVGRIRCLKEVCAGKCTGTK